MKKKAVKLATASAIVASAFAATSVSAAENTVNVDQLVKEAEKHAGALKWGISAEFTADGKTRPDAPHNLTKNALAKAEAAVAKTTGNEKTVFETRLVAVKQQVERSTHYMDAIRASQKVQAMTADLNKAVADKKIEDVIKAHHALTAEVRKQAVILYRVYGQSTRDLILAQTKAPAEKAVAATKVDVTVQTYLNNAADALRADKLEEASKEIAKADAWIGQASSNFKSQLEKYRSELGSSLSLSATGVTRVDNSTVTVKVTKPAGVVLAADDFHFTNGLEVTAIKSVSADGQTYTLTTTEQDKGATYELVFQGKNTGLTFKTPPAQDDGKIDVVSKEYKQLNAGDDRVFKVDVSHINDSKYTGDVKIEVTSETGQSDLSVLAGKANPTNTGTANNQVYTATVGIAGELLFTLSHGGKDLVSDEVTIKVTLLDDNGAVPKSVTLGKTSFYKHASDNDIVESVLTGGKLYAHVPAENYFVYSEDGSTTNALKYSYDNSDVFKIENRTVTLDQFKAALSYGDVIEVDDHSSTKTFHIVSNVSRIAIAPINITTPNQVVRYDGQNYRVSGVGEPGYKVQLFADANGNKAYDFGTDVLVAEKTIGADGKWVVEAMTLAQNERNNLVAVQYAPNDSARDSATKIAHTDWAQVLEGPFALTKVTAIDAVADGFFGIGDTLDFNFLHNPAPKNYDHQVKTTAGAKIEVQDTLGKKATLTVKENTNTKNNLTDVTVVNIERDPLFGFGTVNITSTTGITNQDNQVLNLDASTLAQKAFYAAPFSK